MIDDWDAVGEGWNGWRVDPVARCLVHPNGYYADFDRLMTSAEVLDWICQIATKTWADDATIAGFVRCLLDVLNPQESLCKNAVSFWPDEPPTLEEEIVVEHAMRIALHRADLAVDPLEGVDPL